MVLPYEFHNWFSQFINLSSEVIDEVTFLLSATVSSFVMLYKELCALCHRPIGPAVASYLYFTKKAIFCLR